MHIIYFGSGPFGAPGLLALMEAGHSIPLVVSQPDRPAGRGGKLRQTIVTQTAHEMGIPVLQPESVRAPEIISAIEAEQPELCVVVAYGHKIPPEMLSLPKHGFINAHASLLPKYRGAAPVPHAILNGESETGVTIFRLDEDWDTGPIFGSITTPIRNNDTTRSVLARLSVMSAEVMLNVVSDLDSGTLQAIPQNDGMACGAPKFTREDGLIDWACTPEEIDRKVRAFQPWPEAYTTIPGKRGRKQKLQVLGVEEETDRIEDCMGLPPGMVFEADGKLGLIVAVGGNRALRLTKIKPEGKRAMTGAEYIRGSRVVVGTILGKD